MTEKGKYVMSNIKKYMLGVLTAVFCFVTASVFAVSASAQQNVTVQIAPYYTEIEYMSVYNPAVEFPLIAYKDITYFPMTYNLCARLGLAVGFDESAGLYITVHDIPIDGSATELFGGTGNNSYETYYDAVIPEYPIYLNGIRIDNSKEEYPFISFRGITYFPMTWRFAVEELGFTTEWSAETGFRLYRDQSIHNDVLIGKSDKNGINITFSTYASDSVENSDGSITLLSKQRHERYKLMYENGYASSLGGSDRLNEDDYPDTEVVPDCDKIFFEDGYLRYMNTKILDLADTNAVSQYSKEYVFGDTTFIYTIVEFGGAVAPYNSHSEYIFVHENGNIKRLEEWDEKNNLVNIFPDGLGGFYLCSDYYSPVNSSRWNNEFACVYRYTASGEFYEITITDINSLTAIGVADTKLYVKAMYYAGDKSMTVNTSLPISAVNSGYYEIDSKTGNIKKLYAYIPGKALVGENGKVYLVTTHGAAPRIIELPGGRIIALDQ